MAISPDQQRQINVAFKYSAVGIEMALCVAVGTLGGSWLDKKFDTAPWLLVFGLLIGFGAATKAVVRVITQFKRDQKKSDKSLN